MSGQESKQESSAQYLMKAATFADAVVAAGNVVLAAALHLVPGEGGQEVGLVTLGDGTSKQEENSSNVEPETDKNQLLFFTSWLEYKLVFLFVLIFLFFFSYQFVLFCFLTNNFATLPEPRQRCKGID